MPSPSVIIGRWESIIEQGFGDSAELVFVDLDLEENAHRKVECTRPYMPAIIKLNGREYDFPNAIREIGGVSGICAEFRRLQEAKRSLATNA